MDKASTGAAFAVRVEPSIIIETTQLVRQSHDAIKCVNQLLANAERGSTIECNNLVCLLLPIQERMYGALDELSAVCSRTFQKGAVSE
jgi:hypothetical protein